MGEPRLDPEVLGFYEAWSEETRLEIGLARLEAARTRRIIERFRPEPPATVYDVGGAAGAYAYWLADAGYAVHLLDAVPRLVEAARAAGQGRSRPLVECAVGDARALPFHDRSADVVLLLGPLYHLTEAADRQAALAEVRRVLRPGGWAFAAAVSRWASAFDGLARDLYARPDFGAVVADTLLTGRHRNPNRETDRFTTAYFHRPDELAGELLRAGFELEGVFGLEGPAGLLPDFDRRWADPRQRADLLRIAEAVEREPALAGLSAHLLAVARAP